MIATYVRECECPVPEPKHNRPSVCVRCGFSLDTDWACNDKTLTRFMDRLAECMPGAGETFQQFRLHVEAREAAGRTTFRQTFLGKDMKQNAREEYADACMYVFMDTLKAIREGRDLNMDLALEEAFHAFKGWELSVIRHHKELGAP